MSNPKLDERLKIELTPEQQEQVRQATGQEAAAVELQPEKLEERVAPGLWQN